MQECIYLRQEKVSSVQALWWGFIPYTDTASVLCCVFFLTSVAV